MITGGTAWTTALNANTKFPIYVFSIPNKTVYLSSFVNTVTTFADLTTPAANSTHVLSSSANFQPWMVGFWFPITSGTNFVATNLYKIISVVSNNEVVLNTTPTPSGAGAGGSGSIQFAINLNVQTIPTMNIPKGSSQNVDELNGHSTISGFDVSAIDNSGYLKTISADQSAIGQPCNLRLGFPGSDFSDSTSFVIVDSGTVSSFNRDDKGLMSITVQSTILDLVDQIFANGGPPQWFQMTSVTQIQFVSSGSGDTRLLKIAGWDSTASNVLTESIQLSGTSTVTSVNTYSSIISVSTLIGSRVWTVTATQASDSSLLGVISPGEVVLGGRQRPPAVGPAYLDNGFPIADNNPRYLIGNPIDIALAVSQNEIGIGQTSPPVLVITTGGGSGTGQVGFGINPTWTLYDGSTDLINPNTYLDVPTMINLRDEDFGGDIFEFKYTSTQNGKSWLESQILKVCGLYFIVKADGHLKPKSMKIPTALGSPPTISDHQIMGIPKANRWPLINTVQFEVAAADDPSNNVTLAFANQTSLDIYKAPYIQSIKSDGLRFGRGGITRMALLANRIFARHAFKTPIYEFDTFFLNFVFELGDYFYLTHPKVLDWKTGTMGITNVLCEVVSREPDFSGGKMHMTAVDTRFMSASNGAFQIAAASDSIPAWGSATSLQKTTYMFVCENTGLYSDGITSGNEID